MICPVTFLIGEEPMVLTAHSGKRETFSQEDFKLLKHEWRVGTQDGYIMPVANR